MPTELPTRRTTPPHGDDDAGYRDLMIAATLLLSVLCLIYGQPYDGLPGYSYGHGELPLLP